MKNLILIILIVLTNTELYSQNTFDFFQMLPDSTVYGLSKEQRKQLVDKAEKEWDDENWTIEFEVNGVLHEFYRENDDNLQLFLKHHVENTILEVCYWNLENEDQLVFAYKEWNEGMAYGAESLKLFLYNNNSLHEQNAYDLFLDVPQKSGDFLNDLERIFYKSNYLENKKSIENFENHDVYVGTDLWINFYQDDKKVSFKYGNSAAEEGLAHEHHILKKFNVIGNRIEMVWSDGKFTLGAVSWMD